MDRFPPPTAQAHQNNWVLGTERDRLFHQTQNQPFDQQQARFQAWIASLPQADQAQQNQILDQQMQPIPQQLLERFRQEEQNRQQHIERMQTTIREGNLRIAVPDQSTQEWSRFAANLISEYESEELPLVKDKETGEIVSSQIFGVNLPMSFHQGASVLDSPLDQAQIFEMIREIFKKDGSQPIINARGKQLRDDDIEILTNEDGKIRTEERGLGHSRLLGDILQGGMGQATSNERNSDEYKELMIWVLSRWQDHINRAGSQ